MAIIKRLSQILKPMHSSLGLEITDRYVKLAEVVLQPNKNPVIRQYAVEELPSGTVVEGKINQAMAIIAVLRKMIQTMNFRTKNVHLVLPSQMIMVRFLKLPDIPLKDLKKVVEFEIKHNIHLPFDNPHYDFVKMNGADETVQQPKQASLKAYKQAELARKEAAVADLAGKAQPDRLFGDFDKPSPPTSEALQQCDVMLVASPRELIDEYVEIAEAAGLTTRTIEFKAMSLYRLVLLLGIATSDQTILIVDINDNSSDLSIFHRSALKITRNVPISFAYKEKKQEEAPLGVIPLFSEFTESINQEKEFYRNAYSDLAHELERLINFYRYTLGNRDHEFASIIVSGDIQGIADVVDYCKERLSLNVQVLFSFSIDSDTDDPFTLIPRIAVPIGLGLRGDER